MRALCWHGKQDVRVDSVPEPKIVNPRDAIVRVTLTAICGSDLHLYAGRLPSLEEGDVLGHEFMGEVVRRRIEGGKARRGGSRRRAFHDFLRRVLLLREDVVVVETGKRAASPFFTLFYLTLSDRDP